MRYLAILLFTSLILSACSGSKNIEVTQVNLEPCKNEVKLNDQNPFYGETVDNFLAYQQGDAVQFTMDVRTYCKTGLTVVTDKQENVIKLKLNNTGQNNSDCTCTVKLSSSMKNLKEGSYTVMVTDISGSKLLAQQQLTVK